MISFGCICIKTEFYLVSKYLSNEEINKISEYSNKKLKNWTLRYHIRKLIEAFAELRENSSLSNRIVKFLKFIMESILFALTYVYFNHNLFNYSILDDYFRIRYIIDSSSRFSSKIFCNIIKFLNSIIIIPALCILNVLSIIFVFCSATYDWILVYVTKMILYVLSQHLMGEIVAIRCQKRRKTIEDTVLENKDKLMNIQKYLTNELYINCHKVNDSIVNIYTPQRLAELQDSSKLQKILQKHVGDGQRHTIYIKYGPKYTDMAGNENCDIIFTKLDKELSSLREDIQDILNKYERHRVHHNTTNSTNCDDILPVKLYNEIFITNPNTVLNDGCFTFTIALLATLPICLFEIIPTALCALWFLLLLVFVKYPEAMKVLPILNEDKIKSEVNKLILDYDTNYKPSNDSPVLQSNTCINYHRSGETLV